MHFWFVSELSFQPRSTFLLSMSIDTKFKEFCRNEYRLHKNFQYRLDIKIIQKVCDIRLVLCDSFNFLRENNKQINLITRINLFTKLNIL